MLCGGRFLCNDGWFQYYCCDGDGTCIPLSSIWDDHVSDLLTVYVDESGAKEESGETRVL